MEGVEVSGRRDFEWCLADSRSELCDLAAKQRPFLLFIFDCMNQQLFC